MKKKYLVYCDDQEKWIDRFKQNHQSNYEIEGITDIKSLMIKIDHHKPDLILLDVYHPKDKSSGFKERVEQAEEQITQLEKQIELTRQAVNRAWNPYGIDVLKDIRDLYTARELPVVLYTQHGMSLLSDEDIRRVEELDGHWMRKNYLSDTTEHIRLERILGYSGKSKPILRVYRITLICTYSIAGVIVSLNFISFGEQFYGLIASTAAGFISGILTYLVTKRIEK